MGTLGRIKRLYRSKRIDDFDLASPTGIEVTRDTKTRERRVCLVVDYTGNASYGGLLKSLRPKPVSRKWLGDTAFIDRLKAKRREAGIYDD